MARNPKKIGGKPAAAAAPEFNISYKPAGETLRRFMLSDMFVRGIRGPVGSGKSACCAIEIMRRAMAQAPDPQTKMRRTRFAIVRNTNPELKTTTIKTWLDWFPERVFGKFNWQPPYTHRIIKGDVDLEVIFLAMDRDEDVKKLLSLELTGAWGNEARELPKAVIDGMTMRVGRFPSMKDGGCTWQGVWLDTNAMEPDHWWPLIAGDAPIPEEMDPAEAAMMIRPDNWEFFNQPEGMSATLDEQGSVIGYHINPAAENLANLTPGYYDNMIRGKTRSWINLYVRNRLGSAQEGKVVYPSFREETHVAKRSLDLIPGIPIGVGVDFGLTPAAIFGQKVRGRWIIHRELVATDMGATRFAQQIKHVLAMHFGGYDVSMWGDPSGDSRVQTDEDTPFLVFRAAGLPILPAPSNDPVVRTEAVTLAVERMVDGEPGFLLDPRCPILKAGFIRGYAYPKLQISGGIRYGDAPVKNRYSHPHDALQYLLIGAGDGRALVRRADHQGVKPHIAIVRRNVFARQRNR